MIKIDKETIKEMAVWARVRVPEEEAEVMAKEFTETLAWIGERLKDPDLQKVSPMVSPFDEPIPLRRDEVIEGNQSQEILSNAPDTIPDFFCVPKMVE